MARNSTFIDPAGTLWIIDNATNKYVYMHNAYEQIRVPRFQVEPFVNSNNK